jgi:hypothetical protein
VGDKLTDRPPFDPEELARESEALLRAAKQGGALSGGATAPNIAAVPVRIVETSRIDKLGLAQEDEQLLHLMDGQAPLEMLAALAGISTDAAARIIARLVDKELVTFRPRS